MHKKDCKRRAKERLEEALFKPPPPDTRGDCPVCFLPLPMYDTQISYSLCCGKSICLGCIVALGQASMRREDPLAAVCPFCRVPTFKRGEGWLAAAEKRVQEGDANAATQLGCKYAEGRHGVPKDHKKAMEYWSKGADLGWCESHYKLGYAYLHGDTTTKDLGKAKHHFQLGAIAGNVKARFFLGKMELDVGNFCRALKHFLISARGGCGLSMKVINALLTDGFASKEVFEEALKSYQAAQKEMRSEEREQACERLGIKFSWEG